MNNKKILVIHPSDPTTDFLSVIYKDINAFVIRQSISKKRLKELIKDADKVIMLGHGTADGMGFVKNGFIDFIIDSSLVYLLREKKDNIFIWCNADEFVKKYKLDGFSTGMFISETEESYMYGVEATFNEIQESNERFAKVISNYVNRKSGEELKNIVKEDYVLNSDVARYNHERIYYFKNNIETD